MARYDWSIIAGEEKKVEEKKVGEEKSSKRLLIGALLVGAVGAVLWWKWDEGNREKAALKRMENIREILKSIDF